MDPAKSLEEKLREAACFGDEETVRVLIERGVNVNSKHDINGWTPLHWACKRGHATIVKQLLAGGADKCLPTLKGELASDLANKEEIRQILGCTANLSHLTDLGLEPRFSVGSRKKGQQGAANRKGTTIAPSRNIVCKEEGSPVITPNYLANPAIGYKVNLDNNNGFSDNMCTIRSQNFDQDPELVLKVRLAYMDETDFIEVELPYSELSFKKLLQVCSEELEVDSRLVLKVRKLPDTLLRKDKDVKRLKPFQEIELVLKSRPRPLVVDVSHLSQQSQQQSHTLQRITDKKGFALGEISKSGYIVNGKLLY